MVHLHHGVLLGNGKGNHDFCNNLEVHGNYYAKLNKLLRERQIPHDLIYMRNLMSKIK